MSRAYNFSAGPAALPLEVLQDAQANLVDYKGCGMSVMEMSHRGKDYDAIHQEAIANFKELCGLGDDWAVCFVQGGASMQFAMIPMNFLPKGAKADYAKQGTWSGKALKEGQKVAALRGAEAAVAADCAKDIPTRMPRADEWKWSDGAAYCHICSNETIAGAELKAFPKTTGPLFCDMSSDILSCERDYNQFDMFYAGAQKNLGPSGMAVVAIRKSLAEKAKKIYDVIDGSDFWTGTALPEFRSNMNVTWRIHGNNEELEKKFIDEAKKLGMSSLKGHRSVGGIRASIYNAFPMEGVDALVAFMKDFEKANG